MTTLIPDPLPHLLTQLTTIKTSLDEAQAHLESAWRQYQELQLDLARFREELAKAQAKPKPDPSKPGT